MALPGVELDMKEWLHFWNQNGSTLAVCVPHQALLVEIWWNCFNRGALILKYINIKSPRASGPRVCGDPFGKPTKPHQSVLYLKPRYV